ESGIAHSGREYQIIFEGCAGYRKTSGIAFGVSFRWINERDHNVLSRLELKTGRLLHVERHGVLGHLSALLQFDHSRAHFSPPFRRGSQSEFMFRIRHRHLTPEKWQDADQVMASSGPDESLMSEWIRHAISSQTGTDASGTPYG